MTQCQFCKKDFVKEINANPELNFNELFNNYVQVKYVKYNLNHKIYKDNTLFYIFPILLTGLIFITFFLEY